MRRLFLGSMLGLSLAACGRGGLEDSFGCPEYLLVCDGACTDPSSDAANCGACGSACDVGQECRVGRCRDSCEEPETLCSDGCVDTQSDADNCGSCGAQCAPGARCSQGECSATGCPPGLQRCGDVCVDTATDAEHCGECFAECDAGMRCDGNVCLAGCGEQTNCGGGCVDTRNDPDHCGECRNRCASDQLCEDGGCSSCPNGLYRCDSECVDLATNPDHCGACDASCAPDAVCEQGVCSCAGRGRVVCDGACTDLGTDPNHCGSCDIRCSGPCSGGLCLDECPEGSVWCGDVCVDIVTDSNNCGGCGIACGPGSQCSGSLCEAVCPLPQLLCDDACIDVRTDPENCGGCDSVCEEGLECRAGKCIERGSACDFTRLPFPLALNGGISVADITVDDACNLYVGMQVGDFGGVVYSIDGSTGDVTRIADFSERVRGLVYRPEDGLLYGTSRDRLIAVAPDGSEPRVIEDSLTGEFLNGMTLAPSNWQHGEGYLVVAQSTGEVVIYDPDSPAPETLVSPGVFLSDVEFGARQLYVASYETNEILKITPSGVMNTFVTLPCSPDGLTLEPGSRLFASCGDTGEIYAIDLETAEASWLGQFTLSPGWAPAGLLWQPGVLLVVEETTGLNALFL